MRSHEYSEVIHEHEPRKNEIGLGWQVNIMTVRLMMVTWLAG